MRLGDFSTHPQFKIVLFDAHCVLCQNWTKFLTRYDLQAQFKLVSVQSALGQRLLKTYHFPLDQFDTMLYIEHGTVFTHSTAFIKIIVQLGLPWRFAKIAQLIPKILRDPIYSLIAKNRYHWSGKTETCLVPNAKLKQHFLASYIHA